MHTIQTSLSPVFSLPIRIQPHNSKEVVPLVQSFA